ncbi:MAG: hypothetical protein ACRC3H_07610 [Lachnospiraceae bacterium]
MVTKVKCAMIFLMVFALLPVQVRAAEPEENVGQLEGENLETEKQSDAKDEASKEAEPNLHEVQAAKEAVSELQEVQAENADDSNLQEVDQDETDEEDESDFTGTELTISVVPIPKVETVGDKWKVIKDKKYVLSITITNISSIDFEDVLVCGAIDNDIDYFEFLTFYPQNGVTVNDYYTEELSPIVNAEAVVALLKSGESITLQAEVVIPADMGDEAVLFVLADLNYIDALGYVDYDLQIINDEKKPVQENPKSESGAKPDTKPDTKTVAKTDTKTNNNGSSIKTAAKTGDNSSTAVYLGAIALSALAIMLSRKLYKYN